MIITPKEILKKMSQDSQDRSTTKSRYIYPEIGQEFVIPLLNEKQMEILEKEIKKHIKVNNENLNIKIGSD